jgi:hypothetical protein
MKSVLLALILLNSSLLFADAPVFRTQDNITYLITVVEDDSDWQRCAQVVCEIAKRPQNGNQVCEILPNAGVVIANLTNRALRYLDSVKDCDYLIEKDGVAQIMPRLGTSN